MFLMSWNYSEEYSLTFSVGVWIMRYLKVIRADPEFSIKDDNPKDKIVYTGSATKMQIYVQVFFPEAPIFAIKIGVHGTHVSVYFERENLGPIPYFGTGNGPYVYTAVLEVDQVPGRVWSVYLMRSDNNDKIPMNNGIFGFISFQPI